jgi:hypothetical protein
MNSVFAMMGDETRFWIAQRVTEKKETGDIRPLFEGARERTGKKPMLLITDGAPNFAEENRKEYQTHYSLHTTNHIRDIRFDGSVHTNKMERTNVEVRDREKVLRGLKNIDSPILKGVQIFHFDIRPHSALNARKHGEAAGIQVKGEDKWLTIIQNAGRTKS